MSKDPDLIRHEDAIVWTEDVDHFEYVREHLDLFVSSRTRPVGWNGPGRRVGYATLRAEAPAGPADGRFARRVFWVKDGDRSDTPEGAYSTGAPAEAVDPRTVAPRVWGVLTDRAWGGPLPLPVEARPEERVSGAGGAEAPERAAVVASRDGQVVVGESMSTGLAHAFVGPAGQGQVEVFLDCASGSQFGDGRHVIAETLSHDEAAELLIATVTSTPWLQRALALSVVNRWLEHGTAGAAER